jgi:hypothetical protein
MPPPPVIDATRAPAPHGAARRLQPRANINLPGMLVSTPRRVVVVKPLEAMTAVEIPEGEE